MQGLTYVVLGAGRQGVAAAHDLAVHGNAREVVVADRDLLAARRAVEHLKSLTPDAARGVAIRAEACDATNSRALEKLLEPAAAALCALPYPLIPHAAQAAIAARTSMADLGGNDDVTAQVLALDERAKRARTTLVPDCGVAPGLAGTLVAHGIEEIDEARRVRVRAGGLPQDRDSPLGYRLSFSVGGLVNEYDGTADVLRDGKRVQLPTLTDLETIDLPEPFGRCEAFLTAGAMSTLPQTYEGRLEELDYKTVRYPGHCEVVRGMRDLGLWSQDPVTLAGGQRVAPRAVFEAVADSAWGGDFRDRMILRVDVEGRHEGADVRLRRDVIDEHDEATGFTAMQRLTGWPAAMVVAALARGEAQPGAIPLERALPTGPFLEGLRRRGIRVEESREAL